MTLWLARGPLEPAISLGLQVEVRCIARYGMTMDGESNWLVNPRRSYTTAPVYGSSGPLLDSEVRHSSKVSQVVCHQGRLLGDGMARNEKIHVPNRRT